MWLPKRSRIETLEKRIAAVERVNEAQTKVLQKNQKHMFLITAIACLGLTFNFGAKAIEAEDRTFLYEALRFLMGGAGLAASAKTLQLEELEVNSQPQSQTSVYPQDNHTLP